MKYIALFLAIFLMAATPVKAETFQGREYLIHISQGVKQPAPLALLLHGGGGRADELRKYTKFHKQAKKYGMSVVYANASDVRIWGDGKSRPDLDKKIGPMPDDTLYLLGLIDHLAEQGIVDPNKVFVAGISNGGTMSMALACKYPDRIAGFAMIATSQPPNFHCRARDGQGPAIGENPLAGTTPGAPAGTIPFGSRTPPVPAIFFNGTDDPLVPFEGGRVSNKKHDNMGAVLGAKRTLRLWSKRNGCKSKTETNLHNRSRNDGTTVTKVDYNNCDAPLQHYIVHGGGHTWLGLKQNHILDKIFGKASRDFSTNKAILEFWAEEVGPRRSQGQW